MELYLFGGAIIAYISAGIAIMLCDHRRCNRVGHSLCILTMLMITGTALRCYRLSDMPPGLNEDEYKLTGEITGMLKGDMRLIECSSFTGFPRISQTPLAMIYRLAPACRITFRSWETVCGVLCIPAMFFLANRCLTGDVPFYVAALMTFMPYHLFYSRVTTGTRLIVIELVAIYMLMAALEHRSLWRTAYAVVGAGLLQYDYLAGRAMVPIFALGMLVYLCANSVPTARIVKCALVVVLAASVMFVPIYMNWQRNPHGFYFHRAVETMPPARLLPTAFSNSINMFRDAHKAVDGFCTQADAQVLPETWFWMLMFGLLLSFTAYLGWPASFIGAMFLLSLLPSCLSSVGGNSHRALLSIPAVLLLTGYGLQRCAGGCFARCILISLVAAWCVWGAVYFYRDMWTDKTLGRMRGLWGYTENGIRT